MLRSGPTAAAYERGSSGLPLPACSSVGDRVRIASPLSMNWIVFFPRIWVYNDQFLRRRLCFSNQARDMSRGCAVDAYSDDVLNWFKDTEHVGKQGSIADTGTILTAKTYPEWSIRVLFG